MAAQQRPLITQEVEVIQPGELLVQFGFEFLQEARFPLAGLEGDLTRVGVVALHFGISRRVEVQLEGSVRNFLSVSEQRSAFVTPILTQGGDSTDDVGDFSIAAKAKLFSEQGRRPSLGFRFGFEMPTSDERRGIGLNTTNIFAALLLQKHFGRLNTFAHAGLGILEAPAGLFAQNDVLLLGWGIVVPVNKRLNIVGEVQGRKSTRNTPATSALAGTGSRGQGRLGIQFWAGGFRWDLAGIAGLTKNDADTGFTFGVSKTIRLFSSVGDIR
ncbi:MAG: hypothetical protein ACE5H2_03045 [Terriglobia bacterium]